MSESQYSMVCFECFCLVWNLLGGRAESFRIFPKRSLRLLCFELPRQNSRRPSHSRTSAMERMPLTATRQGALNCLSGLSNLCCDRR